MVLGLAGCLLWAYWPALVVLEKRWATDPQSSHCFLVPLFAAIVLWTRRSTFPAGPWTITPWGLVFIVVAALLRLGSAYFYLDWFDGFSLIVTLVGIAVLVSGWKLLLWAWPGVVMLLFMLPLPYPVENALASPLQRAATVAATYVLQTLGYPAIAEGNVIVIDDLRLGVVEACSGLGMLAAFFALSTAVVFVMYRPRYEKVIVLVSAIPIGLLVNLIRITAMAWAHLTFGQRLANALFHDYAGWLMMPLALLSLWLELLVLQRLLVSKKVSGPIPVVHPRPVAHQLGRRSSTEPAPAID